MLSGSSKLIAGLVHGHDVFRGTDGLYVVTGSEDISAVTPQDIEVVQDLGLDILNRVEGQGLLIVHPAVEYDLAAKVPL